MNHHDACGEVGGIDSQRYGRSGGFQGLPFAIPIDLATQVEDQIVVAVDSIPAKGVEQAKKVVADSKKAVALLIRRNGATILIPVHAG